MTLTEITTDELLHACRMARDSFRHQSNQHLEHRRNARCVLDRERADLINKLLTDETAVQFIAGALNRERARQALQGGSDAR